MLLNRWAVRGELGFLHLQNSVNYHQYFSNSITVSSVDLGFFLVTFFFFQCCWKKRLTALFGAIHNSSRTKGIYFSEALSDWKGNDSQVIINNCKAEGTA